MTGLALLGGSPAITLPAITLIVTDADLVPVRATSVEVRDSLGAVVLQGDVIDGKLEIPDLPFGRHSVILSKGSCSETRLENYDSVEGRFMTADPSAPRDSSVPQSFNLYSYVMGDPVNATDPEGLEVEKIDITVDLKPTCFEEFTNYISISVGLNEYLSSDKGTMALQVYWEHRGVGTSVDKQVWTGIANVFRNRWHLSNADKRKYGFTTAAFKQLIYTTSGSKWNQSGSAQATASIWDPDGKLKSQYRSQLINILNSSPKSADCHGLIDAFSTSNRIYNASPHDESVDTTSGALWFYATGSDNSIPENPFRLGYDIFPSAIVPVSFSAGRSVSWIFYRLVDGWSY